MLRRLLLFALVLPIIYIWLLQPITLVIWCLHQALANKGACLLGPKRIIEVVFDCFRAPLSFLRPLIIERVEKLPLNLQLY